MQIDFDIFELEKSEKCKNDYVEFREVEPKKMEGVRGPILTGRLCGSTKPSSIQSSGNMVWVQFKSDRNSTTVYKGFKASFKAGLWRIEGRGSDDTPWVSNYTDTEYLGKGYRHREYVGKTL